MLPSKGLLLIAMAAVAIVAAGCGKSLPAIVEAEGIVRLDGVPLYKAEVLFFPVENLGTDYVAKGETDKAGRFTLTCQGKPGACVGEHRVLVVEAELPANVKGENAQLALAAYLRSLGGRPIPQRYANLVESPLRATVDPDKKVHTFDLSR